MKRNPTRHSMERRSQYHDYSRTGIYHITLKANKGLAFGRLEGRPDAPDGNPDAPHIILSAAGKTVEHELLHGIPGHYPMVTVDTYTIMPDHMHLLLRVTAPLESKSGKPMHLGMVIKGFKYGCNRRYWQLLGLPTGHQADNNRATESPGTLKPDTAEAVCPPFRTAGVSVGGAYPSLFQDGYCDVMPVDAEQLETQRNYIRQNARSRLLRAAHPDRLTARRGAVPTALTVNALTAYLRHECAPGQATPEALAAIAGQLLIRAAGREIVCDSYGERGLLAERLLPVVCHRRDKGRLAEQRRRCLEEAAAGAVLVSPRIAKGEQEIIDAALAQGLPVVLVEDNGFPDRYHPSAERQRQCAEGRLLLVSPWRYRYRSDDEAVTLAFCKSMNAVAQALSRKGDGWWKERSSFASS